MFPDDKYISNVLTTASIFLFFFRSVGGNILNACSIKNYIIALSALQTLLYFAMVFNYDDVLMYSAYCVISRVLLTSRSSLWSSPCTRF